MIVYVATGIRSADRCDAKCSLQRPKHREKKFRVGRFCKLLSDMWEAPPRPSEMVRACQQWEQDAYNKDKCENNEIMSVSDKPTALSAAVNRVVDRLHRSNAVCVISVMFLCGTLPDESAVHTEQNVSASQLHPLRSHSQDTKDVGKYATATRSIASLAEHTGLFKSVKYST